MNLLGLPNIPGLGLLPATTELQEKRDYSFLNPSLPLPFPQSLPSLPLPQPSLPLPLPLPQPSLPLPLPQPSLPLPLPLPQPSLPLPFPLPQPSLPLPLPLPQPSLPQPQPSLPQPQPQPSLPLPQPSLPLPQPSLVRELPQPLSQFPGVQGLLPLIPGLQRLPPLLESGPSTPPSVDVIRRVPPPPSRAPIKNKEPLEHKEVKLRSLELPMKIGELPPLESSNVSKKNEDMGLAWEKSVKLNLQGFTKAQLDQALIAGGLPVSKDKNTAIIELINLIKSGVNVKLPIEYLKHFIGGKQDVKDKHKILDTLSSETLIQLITRLRIVNRIEALEMTRDAIISALVNYDQIFSSLELDQLNQEQLRTLLRSRNIPFSPRDAISTLKSRYIKYYTDKGITIPTLPLWAPEPESTQRPLIEPSYALQEKQYNFINLPKISFVKTAENNLVIGPVGDIKLYEVKEIKSIEQMLKGHLRIIPESGYNITLMDYIIDAPEKDLDKYLTSIGLQGLKGTWEDKLQIIWLHYVHIELSPTIYSEEEIKEIITSSTSNLYLVVDYLLETRHIDPNLVYILRDRAFIVWFLLTGLYIRYDQPRIINDILTDPVPLYSIQRGHNIEKASDITKYPVYEQVTKRNGQKVNMLVEYLYNYKSSGMLLYLTPYRYLALIYYTNLSSVLEPFIEHLGSTDIQTMIKENGDFMIMPGGLTAEQQLQYFLRNIKDYEQVFNRKNKPGYPWSYMTQKIFTYLRLFTDKELIDGYGHIIEWKNSRYKYIAQIIGLFADRSRSDKWLLGKQDTPCVNQLPQFNAKDPLLTMIQPHGNICYTTSQLTMHFVKDNDGYNHFRNPDYSPPGKSDYVDMTKEFNDTQLLDLRDIIVENPKDDNSVKAIDPIYQNLLDSILRGLTEDNSTKTRYVNLSWVNQMKKNDDDRKYLQKIIYSMFLLGLYARYWEGPGHQYPYQYVEKKDSPDSSNRDKRVQLEYEHLLNLVEMAKPEIQMTFNEFRVVRYEWSSGNAYLSKMKYISLINYKRKRLSPLVIQDIAERGLETAIYYYRFVGNVDILHERVKESAAILPRLFVSMFVPELVNSGVY